MRSPVNPLIGKFYRVPVVEVLERKIIAPVLLPLHEDSELLKFKPLHFHVDWRFVNRSHRWAWKFVDLFRVDLETIYGQVVCVEDWLAGTQFEYSLSIKRIRCVREWPEWPCWKGLRPKLEAAFTGKTAPGCKTCPHKGISLEVGRRFQHPATGRETVECPGHGLWWDAETGRFAGLREFLKES